MSTAKRVIKNTGFLYAKMGITMFISLYSTRLILNTLGPTDFGIFNVVGGAITLLGFLNAAMANATQRFMSYSEGEGDKEKQKRIFNISVILHFFLALVLGILLIILGYFYFNIFLNIAANRLYAAKVVYISLIVSTVFTVMTVPYDAVLNARENMLYYAIVGIIESILKLAVAVTVACIDIDKLILYGVLMAIIPLLIMTIMRVYCHCNYEECVINPRKYWDKELSQEMRSFAGWSLLGSMSSIISQSGTSLLMNVFHGTVANASQGIANQISGQLGILGSSIKKALTPTITKSVGANNYNLMTKTTILGTKIVLFFVTFMFLPFIIEMPFILSLWLKNPPKYAQIFCSLILLINYINDLVLFLPQAINAVGKIKGFQVSNSILLFLPLVISYIAFTNGAEAYFIYLITAFISLLQNFIIMYYAEKLCNISFRNYFFNVVIRCTIVFSSVLWIGSIVNSYYEESLQRLLVTTVSTCVIYGTGFYFISLTNEERDVLKEYYKQLHLRITFR